MRFSLNYKAVMPMRAIDLKPLAREDWRGIWDHGMENWSATTAKSYYNRIANRLEDLAVGKLIGLPAYNYPGVLKSLIGSHAHIKLIGSMSICTLMSPLGRSPLASQKRT